MLNAPAIGEEAPDAVVYREPKQPIRLHDLRGKPLVILFFPLAYSSVCTAEMCAVGEDYGAYEELGGQVVGISVDSPYITRKFAADCNVSFPLLSDFNREAVEAFGVRNEDHGGLRGVARRAVFVLDADGRVVYRWAGEHPGVMPPFEEVKRALREASEKA